MNATETTLAALKREAQQSAEWRGHAGTWVELKPTLARFTCTACGMEVGANSRPLPNEADISGPAVALNCPHA